MKLSISVVCYNSPLMQLQSLMDSIFASINHLRSHYELPTVSIFIIDNSDESTALSQLYRREGRRFEELKVELRLISGHGNVGYGRGHNLALHLIESDFHLLLNPNVTFAEDALFRGLSFMSGNKGIKALSPNTTDPKGNKQYLCKSYPSVFTLLIRGLGLAVLEKSFSSKLSSYELRDLPEDKPTVGKMLFGGCFMLIDTLIFKEVNGFDERYFLYFEDFDLSIRISKLGKLVYAPEVRITHSGGNTSSKGVWHIWKFCISGLRFFSKHGWRFF